QLQSADLRNTNLSYVSLRWADLTEVNLRGANLYGVDLCGASLRYAILSDADLAGVEVNRETRFRQNEGLAPEQRRDLIQRGAVFED
ncbi:MAG: pentapeptide repeat-containing protein, partial [Microcoleus sp. SIO2G3]|nr:pentapeptide repeat-containing protein [Microcoleus sp. SIO2G3]